MPYSQPHIDHTIQIMMVTINRRTGNPNYKRVSDLTGVSRPTLKDWWADFQEDLYTHRLTGQSDLSPEMIRFINLYGLAFSKLTEQINNHQESSRETFLSLATALLDITYITIIY